VHLQIPVTLSRYDIRIRALHAAEREQHSAHHGSILHFTVQDTGVHQIDPVAATDAVILCRLHLAVDRVKWLQAQKGGRIIHRHPDIGTPKDAWLST
jgi:hypothetical protein